MMNYIVFYNRLKSYETLRQIKNEEDVEAGQLRMQSKEHLIYGLGIVAIIICPITVIVRLIPFVRQYDKSETLIEVVNKFQVQFLILFFLVTIGLAVSTYASIMQMRRVFGDSSVEDEKTIKITLYVFCLSYILRVIVQSIIFAEKDRMETIFADKYAMYMGI